MQLSDAEIAGRSARFVVDLQACQTHASAGRGVGRYSSSLLRALLIKGGFDIRVLVSTSLPHEVKVDRVSTDRVVSIPSFPNWGSGRDYEGGARDSLDRRLLSALVAPFKPDVIHVSHVFEGFRDAAVLPSPESRAPGQILSATLFDLIPLVFQDKYFRDDSFRRWYLRQTNWLQQADLLLSISESSKRDAVAYLGIDPSRITTIYGGVSDYFRPPANAEAERHRLRRKFDLRDRFVVYAGGDDPRKNLMGAIAGYQEVPASLREDCQLVIVCAMEDHRRDWYLKAAKDAGLAPGDVVFTGFVSEPDLLAFYGTCDAFVFPSLYEGLGLPVLEAMACGAPVIGADNSSIRELIARKDALFNVNSSRATGDTIAKVLADRDFARELREYGIVRAREFTWERTASLAYDAFADAMARSREAGVQSAIHGWLPRKRLAVFTPLPPLRSGIADYNAQFLPFLARHFDVDVFVDPDAEAPSGAISGIRVLPSRAFDELADAYDAVLYEMGNSQFHAYMLPHLQKRPGIIGLHDAYLSGLVGFMHFRRGEYAEFEAQALSLHGLAARKFFAPAFRPAEAIHAAMVELPCTKHFLDGALGIISHSPFNLQLARKFYPEGWKAPYRTIPQSTVLPHTWSSERIAIEKEALGFSPDSFIIATFGHVAWPKWGDLLLEAFLASILPEKKEVHLVYAGELATDEFGDRLQRSVADAGLGERIRITGFLSDADYLRFIQITDVAVQLRSKSRGGTPRGVLDCLSHGIPVLLNDDGSYTDYPADVVRKLPGQPSVSDIARQLEALYNVQEIRTALGIAGRTYVERHHSPSRCAAEYAAAIHEFMEREEHLTKRHQVGAFARNLANCSDVRDAVERAAQWLESIPEPRFERRRLWIAVAPPELTGSEGPALQEDWETIKALYRTSRGGFEPIVVAIEGGVLTHVTDRLEKEGFLVPSDFHSGQASRDVAISGGDLLLLLDDSRNYQSDALAALTAARNAGASIYKVIWEQVTTPPSSEMSDPEGDGNFKESISSFLDQCDGLLCVHKETADYLKELVTSDFSLANRPNVGYWRHSCSSEASGVERGSVETPEGKNVALGGVPGWDWGVQDLLRFVIDNAGWEPFDDAAH